MRTNLGRMLTTALVVIIAVLGSSLTASLIHHRQRTQRAARWLSDDHERRISIIEIDNRGLLQDVRRLEETRDLYLEAAV